MQDGYLVTDWLPDEDGEGTVFPWPPVFAADYHENARTLTEWAERLRSILE